MPVDLTKLDEMSLEELQTAYKTQQKVVSDARSILMTIKQECVQRFAEAEALKKLTPAQLDKLIQRKVGQGAIKTKGASAAGA